MTTLPQEAWSDQEVLQLYRARGPAELAYKRMEQVLHFATIHACTQEQAQAEIRAVLHQASPEVMSPPAKEAVTEESAEAQAGDGAQSEAEPISSWLLTDVCLETLWVHVQGHWSVRRLRQMLPCL